MQVQFDTCLADFSRLETMKGDGCERSITENEGARGVMVIVAGNEHGDTSSNPGRD